MTTTSRASRSNRSILDDPWLAVAVVLAFVLVAAVALGSGWFGAIGPGPTSPPTGAPASPSPTPSPATPTFARPTPSPQPTFTSYVVQSGDTLSSIARHFQTTARSIAWWNRDAYASLDPESPAYDPNRVEVGWVLMILPGIVVDETNPPTPAPGTSVPATPPPPTTPPATPRPPTAPPATPRPSAVAGPATVVSHGPRSVRNIALTFDMGGRLDPAVDIVRWLIDHEVHATLFPTGKSGTMTTQGLAAMRLAATRPDLFDFANHSWDHPDFRNLTRSQMADQLRATETALLPVVGTTKPWFRPPFGGLNEDVRAGVGAAGWRYIVMWDIDTIDWRPVDNDPPGPTAAQIAAKVRNNAQGGSIVLMHLGGWNTLQALPGILDACRDLGLKPVTLTEMLGG